MAAPLRESSYVGGRYVQVRGKSDRITIRDPARNEVLAQVAVATANDVESCINVARAAQRVWASWPLERRANVLRSAAAIVRSKAMEIAALECRNTGRPIKELQSIDIPAVVDALDYFASVCTAVHGEHQALIDGFVTVQLEPVGVCATLGAWNYPIEIACWKSAPALIAGNAVIHKPSELTPLSSLVLAEILTEAGLPDGVFNVICGGGKIGQTLAGHPGIDKVSLTGSIPTGRSVMAEAAQTIKPVVLELGGNSPLLVLEDANIELAARLIAYGNFLSTGQLCAAPKRVLVHESIKAQLLERLGQLTTRLRVGDPLDPTTEMGSLISQQHKTKVNGYIQRAKEDGAQLVFEGRLPEDPALVSGAFVAPCIFDGCTDSMPIVREEVFGPIVTLLSFATEEEAVGRANETIYGLAAGVCTTDIARAHRIVRRLDAGICWINSYYVMPMSVPYGGFKQSGIGYENGITIVREFFRRKTVYTPVTAPRIADTWFEHSLDTFNQPPGA